MRSPGSILFKVCAFTLNPLEIFILSWVFTIYKSFPSPEELISEHKGCQLTMLKSLNRVRLFATLWTVVHQAHQAPQSMGFSRQEYWSGLPFPSPGDLPDPGIEPRSPALKADALTSEPPGKLCGECKLVQPLWRTVWRFLEKLDIELPYDPAIPLLGIHTEETRIERDTCTPKFIAALFIIART